MISAPVPNQINQRNGSNQSVITVTGISTSPQVDSVEAKFIPITGYSGEETDWMVIDSSADFSGEVTVSAGWYYLLVRAKYLGNVVSNKSTTPVGVGDLFVISGQSNAANHGETARPANDIVKQRRYNDASDWVSGSDQQRSATGAGGSPWPDFGNYLSGYTTFPVGILDVAIASTTVQSWQPDDATNHYARIKTMVQSLPVNGFRSFLWHQGESDNAAGTDQATYTAKLKIIIDQARADAGWDFPFGVAQTSWEEGALDPAIIAAQTDVGSNYPNCFQGANTDTIDPSLRYQNEHFTAAGLQEHGLRWKTAVVAHFGW